MQAKVDHNEAIKGDLLKALKTHVICVLKANSNCIICNKAGHWWADNPECRRRMLRKIRRPKEPERKNQRERENMRFKHEMDTVVEEKGRINENLNEEKQKYSAHFRSGKGRAPYFSR